MNVPINLTLDHNGDSLFTANVLHKAILEHLQSSGMEEVAAEMLRENEIKVVNSISDELISKMCINNSINSSKRLTLNQLNPDILNCFFRSHTATRVVIQKLLNNGEFKLKKQFYSMGLPPPNSLCLQYMLYPNKYQMWSSQDEADALYVKGKKTKGPGNLNFGTLHQLIEELTHVSVMPLSSISEEKTQIYEKFTLSLLRQHRYFTLTHTLLAKLMERFLVPFSIKLGFENFERHGINVHAPGSSLSPILSISKLIINDEKKERKNQINYFSPSATLWLRVCQKIQTRVLSVILLWLREYPEHFDEDMYHFINIFIDDCCFSPRPWSDCPSQLIQMAEFLRTCISENFNLKKLLKTPKKIITNRCYHYPHDCPPTLEYFLKNFSSITDQNFSILTIEKSNNILSLCNTQNFGINISLGNNWNENAKEIIKDCISIPVEKYANALTALHLQLFYSIETETLLQINYNSTASFYSSNYFINSPLGIFLTASVDLSSWVISVFLSAAAFDGYQIKLLRDKKLIGKNFIHVYKHFVDLLIAFIRLNNLHGAIGIYRGLKHPLIQRVITHPELIKLFPFNFNQNIENLSTILGYNKETGNENSGICSIEDYINGIQDKDIYPPIPPVQLYLNEIERIQYELPSFLSVKTDEIYPSINSCEKQEEIIVIHWRKYMIIDEIQCKIIAWKPNLIISQRDDIFEKNFIEQKRKIINEPWRLARMTIELFSVL